MAAMEIRGDEGGMVGPDGKPNETAKILRFFATLRMTSAAG